MSLELDNNLVWVTIHEHSIVLYRRTVVDMMFRYSNIEFKQRIVEQMICN